MDGGLTFILAAFKQYSLKSVIFLECNVGYIP